MSTRTTRSQKRKELSASPGCDGKMSSASVGVDNGRVTVDDTPCKKIKTSAAAQASSARKGQVGRVSKDLLPAVSITLVFLILFVSVFTSDVGRSDVGDVDIPARGFIDDEAEESEGNDVSDSEMAVEADWGDDCTSDAGMASIDEPLPTSLYADEYEGSDDAKSGSDNDGGAALDTPFSPAASDSKRARQASVKTEKGLYVESLMSAGQCDDIALEDDDLIDPTVPCDVLDADADTVNPKPDVYLNDLYPDPLLPARSRESRPVEKLGRGAAKKHAAAAQLASNKRLKVDVAVVDSGNIFRKTVVLDNSPDTDPNELPHKPRLGRKSMVSDSDRARMAARRRDREHDIASLSDHPDLSTTSELSSFRDDTVSTRTPVPVLPQTPVSSPGRVQAHRTPSRSVRNKPLSATSGSVKATNGKGSSVKQSGTKPLSAAGSGSAKVTSAKGGAVNWSGKSSVVTSIDDAWRLSGDKLMDAIGKLVGNFGHDSSPKVDVTRPVLRMSSETCVVLAVSPLDVSEPDDPELQVMQAMFMEERLIKLKVYENMPSIGRFCKVIPVGFDPDTFEVTVYVTFDDIASLFRVSSLTSLVEFFNFVVYGAYVNPARAPLGTITLMNRKASIANETVVCLMAGVVTECLLFDSAVLGGYQGASGIHGGKKLRRIRLKPIQQFWRWNQTVWSVVFDLPFAESTCVSESGIIFPTWVEDMIGKTNKNSKYPSAPSMPSKWKSVPRALKATSTVPGAGYPTSMGYRDDVPIYDGRNRAGSQFLFRPSDFDNLKSLPLYTGDRDLDAFTLVTVGYSLGVWSSYNDQPRVRTNVLFVIVLGSAPSRSVLEANNLLGLVSNLLSPYILFHVFILI